MIVQLCMAAARTANVEGLAPRYHEVQFTTEEARSIRTAAIIAGQLEPVRWLLTACRPPCACATNALEYAAEHGHLEVLKFLIFSAEVTCAWDGRLCEHASRQNKIR